MIVLIASPSAGQEYKALLEKGCGERVQLVGTMSEALDALGTRQYSAVIMDGEVARRDPEGECRVLNACGTAFPVYVSLASSVPERVLDEVRGALRRRQADQLAAVRKAGAELRDELKNAVTGILLSSELAMAVPELPRSAQVKIKFVHDLAQGMRRHLEA